MCGICGFAGEGNQDDLYRMTGALYHRGPDDQGFWISEKESIYFGHRRLSIIDLEGGRQPMSTSDKKLIVTFNGEIYNHRELRKELQEKGNRFVSDHSDTEVLLHGYREWGFRLPEKLNGMWAFAIFDRLRGILFVSRDRFGKKPIYYSLQNNTFAFASELSSIRLHGNIHASLNELGVMKYFAYGYVPEPNTMCERIYKLPAGHNLILQVQTLGLTIRKYWDFKIEPSERVSNNTVEQWAEAIREHLQKAVERRLMSDVPLGIFLSGGIDSSAVAAFAAQIAGKENVKTFSVGFEEKSFDESAYSKMVAELLGISHNLETFSIGNATRVFERLIQNMDDPIGDGSILPTFLLCKSARKKVKVALGGDGADELFAGYDPFRALRLAELYQKWVPKPVHKGIRMFFARLPVSHRNMSLDFKINRTLKGLSYPKPLWNPIWLGPLGPHELKELFSIPVDIEEVYSEALEIWENSKRTCIVDQTLQFYTRLYLRDDILVKVDRASMMNSLEVRAPFLDIDLVNLVRRIPHQFKFRKGQTKYILKKTLEYLLPSEILHRPKKGFGMPLGLWYKNGKLRIPKSPRLELFNHRFLHRKIKNHLLSLEDNRSFLFNMHLFHNWYAKDKSSTPP